MKTITIVDGGARAEYTLTGDVLAMTRSGGCRDALTENDCDVAESMADDEIADAVRESWVIGYDGDPEENGLYVSINDIPR